MTTPFPASDTTTAAKSSGLREILDFQSRHRNLLLEMTDLLIYEGWLLDNGRLEDWLALMADDIRYVAPSRRKIPNEELTLASIDNSPLQISHYNDGKMELGFRVGRMRTGFDHYNRPTSLSRRILGNFRLLAVDETSSQVTMTSNAFIFRAREDKEETLFVCARDDIWRRSDTNGWVLHRRMIRLDHHMIPPLSVFL